MTTLEEKRRIMGFRSYLRSSEQREKKTHNCRRLVARKIQLEETANGKEKRVKGLSCKGRKGHAVKKVDG